MTVPRRYLPLAVVVLASIVPCSLLVGSTTVGPAALVDALSGRDTYDAAVVASRADRTIIGLIVGASLGVAGAAIQSLLRNPLGDPGILGVSTGSGFAVVLAMAYLGITSPVGVVGAALVGASVAATFVYAVASTGRVGATPVKLTLAGAATTAALGSLTTAVLATNTDSLESFQAWQVGSVAGRDHAAVTPSLPLLALGLLLVLLSARALDAFSLGDQMAAQLGRKVARDRAVIALGIVLLTGAATVIAGPVGFVGLIAPHAARLLGSVSARLVLPVSAVIGGAVVVAADTVGRVVLPPTEVEVGIMTALVGGPLFIALLRGKKLVTT